MINNCVLLRTHTDARQLYPQSADPAKTASWYSERACLKAEKVSDAINDPASQSLNQQR